MVQKWTRILQVLNEILSLKYVIARHVMSILAFFRYLPKNTHPMTVYVRSGVDVDKKRSNEKRVTLKNLRHSTTGRYRCEVSTEGPTFATESKYGDLMVVGKFLGHSNSCESPKSLTRIRHGQVF